jgi:hypothetical protein
VGNAVTIDALNALGNDHVVGRVERKTR